MATEVIVALIAAVPPTLGSLAALWKAVQAEQNTRPNGRGTVVDITERTEDKVDDLTHWAVRHDEMHKQQDLPTRVEDLERIDKWLE